MSRIDPPSLASMVVVVVVVVVNPHTRIARWSSISEPEGGETWEKKEGGEKKNEGEKRNKTKEKRDGMQEEKKKQKRRDERKEESEDGSGRQSASRSRSSSNSASDGWLNLPPGYKKNPILLKPINIPVRLSSMVGAESDFQLPGAPLRRQAMALSSPSSLPPFLLYTLVPLLHSRCIAVVVSTQKKQRRRLDPVACASNRKR